MSQGAREEFCMSHELCMSHGAHDESCFIFIIASGNVGYMAIMRYTFD